MQEMIKKIREYVKEKMQGESSGHDFFHVERVLNNALNINRNEGGDEDLIALASLLHDIGDSKITGNPETEHTIPRDIMIEFGVPDELKERVLRIIAEMSYRGSHQIPSTLEGRIVQDADRLDALGAMGVARTFAYGGKMGREMWNPEMPPVDQFKDADHYRTYRGSSLNHFDEKLFKLAELMNTKSGRAIADERTAFLLAFYERFKQEWNGNK